MRFRFLPCASMIALVAACGGASGSADLFAGATFAGNNDGGPGTDGSVLPPDPGADGGGLPGDGGPGTKKDGGGTKKDAAAIDASPPFDAGNDPGIYCGTNGGAEVFCAVGSEECCASPSSLGNTFACKPRGTSCSGCTTGV